MTDPARATPDILPPEPGALAVPRPKDTVRSQGMGSTAQGAPGSRALPGTHSRN